jgi:2-oxoglutarate ferredoxin oxidoreductase subunit beta
MAPTTLPGMITTSSQTGRDVELQGYPLRVSEMLATTSGAAYIVRRSVHDIANIRKTKKALMTAFKVQMQGMGFSLVEILSTCPTNWGIPAASALQFIEEKMIPYYPLGDYKVMEAVRPLVVN